MSDFNRREWQAITVILVLALTLLVFTAWPDAPIPNQAQIFRGFDETSVFEYIEHFVLEKRQLLNYPSPQHPLGRYHWWADAGQPPLYFFLMALFAQALCCMDANGWVLALHLPTLAFSVLTVFLVMHIARQVFPKPGWRALAAGLYAALQPTRIFLTSNLHNIGLAYFLVTVFVYFLVKRQKPLTPSDLFITGLLMGLGIWTRYTTLVTVPFAALWFYLNRQRLGNWKRNLAMALGVALVVALPHFLSNLAVYGKPLSAGTAVALTDYQKPSPGLPTLEEFKTILPAFFTSFWYHNHPATALSEYPVYAGLLVFTLLALAGLAKYVQERKALGALPWNFFVSSLAMCGAILLVLFHALMTTYFNAEGRMLLDAVPSVSIFFPLGLYWLGKEKKVAGWDLGLLLVAGLLLVMAYFNWQTFFDPGFVK